MEACCSSYRQTLFLDPIAVRFLNLETSATRLARALLVQNKVFSLAGGILRLNVGQSSAYSCLLKNVELESGQAKRRTFACRIFLEIERDKTGLSLAFCGNLLKLKVGHTRAYFCLLEEYITRRWPKQGLRANKMVYQHLYIYT